MKVLHLFEPGASELTLEASQVLSQHLLDTVELHEHQLGTDEMPLTSTIMRSICQSHRPHFIVLDAEYQVDNKFMHDCLHRQSDFGVIKVLWYLAETADGTGHRFLHFPPGRG